MTDIGADTLTWDYNGQLTESTIASLEYNWSGKLRSATAGADSISLKYDPLGNRVYKSSTVDSVTTNQRFIVDIASRLPIILCVIDADDGSLERSYIYSGAQPLAFYEGDYSDPNYFYLHDRLGSVRQVIDSSGNVANTYTYTPFGQLLATETTESTENPFRFTGQWFDDEIDQYYLRARQYDPQISRFTSRDPVEGKFDKPPTLHVYLYCANEPINRIDPWGLDSVALYDGSEWGYGERRFESANDFDYFINVGSVEGAANLLKLLTKWGPLRIDDLYIFDHGLDDDGIQSNERQEIGNDWLDYNSKEWETIADSVEEGGAVHLRGCYIAMGKGGQEYIMNLAIEGNVRVDAFTGEVTHDNFETWGLPDYVAKGDLWEADPSYEKNKKISSGHWYHWWLLPFRRW